MVFKRGSSLTGKQIMRHQIHLAHSQAGVLLKKAFVCASEVTQLA